MQIIPPHILKGVELGLIPAKRILQWAEMQIMATDPPAFWLTELVTTQLEDHDLVSAMKEHGASSDVDEDTFLSLVAFGFFRSPVRLERIREILFDRFCVAPNEMTPLRQQVYIFDDEMGWDATRAHRTCENLLRPYREKGEELLREPPDAD